MSTVRGLILCAGVLVSSLAHAGSRLCPEPWRSGLNSADCAHSEMKVNSRGTLNAMSFEVNVLIRNGYILENPAAVFKGNIIYYQGLGDSMLNHMPLFRILSDAGYRVIAFDYMGQGGSTGDMNDTRIFEIATIGNQVWLQNARDLEHFPKKTIIGWSTGGLAAYLQGGRDTGVDKVVLIAPGIRPKLMVGEQHPLSLSFNRITLPTLTTAQYSSENPDPHIDAIKPSSPLEVMGFATDLIRSAYVLGGFSVRADLRGFVLLSGDEDTYVKAKSTKRLIKKTAPHFKIRRYVGALHEIDNEAEPIGSSVRQDILEFIEGA